VLKDKSQSQEFRSSEHWKSPLLDFKVWVPVKSNTGKKTFKSNSLSGNERNRLIFGSNSGFKERTLVSGVDCKEDARSFALLDFDRDGWLDFALASTNGQRLRLFRNRMGDIGGSGRVVEVAVEGSQVSSTGEVGKSNRDAVGSVLTAVTDRRTRVFRKSIGEGLAAQNSGRIRVTLAEGETLQSLSVRWPSGKTTEIKPVLEKKQIEIKE